MQLVYNIRSGVPHSRSKGFLSYKLLGNFLATCAFWSNVLATFAICSNFWLWGGQLATYGNYGTKSLDTLSAL